MQVILLEKIGKLGDLGDVVKVKDGYARNFLIPTKLRAPRHRGRDQGVREPAAPSSRRPPPTSWPPPRRWASKLIGQALCASRRRPASTAACSGRSRTPTSPRR